MAGGLSDRIPAAVPYTLLMFSAAAWAILYALDLLTASLPLKILFHNLRFLVLPFFAILELWLVIAYVKRTEWLRKRLGGSGPDHPGCRCHPCDYQPAPYFVPV